MASLLTARVDMSKGETKNKGGRPKKSVDWSKVDALAKYHCTAQEIAAYLISLGLGHSYDTFDRRAHEEHGCSFAKYIEQKCLAQAKPKLRKLQWKAAESGSVPMLIWLGKQYLDQHDKREIDQGTPPEQQEPVDFNIRVYDGRKPSS